MAYYGVDFNNDFEQATDQVFSDYYGSEEKRTFFNRVFQLAITAKYQTLIDQKRLDQLRGLLKMDFSVPASSGRIFLQPIALTAYNSTTGFATTAFPHNISVGETISYTINGFSGSSVVSAVTSNTLLFTTGPATGSFISGQVSSAQSITDYMHLLSVRATYRYKSYFAISNLSLSPQKIVMETRVLTPLRTGTKIEITGVTGATNANGEKYLKEVGKRKYQLFEDILLTTPTVSNANAYGGSPFFYQFKTSIAFQKKPDGMNYTDPPSINFPKWKEAENALIMEPGNNVVSLEIDYLTKMPIVVDPFDNTVDLELYLSFEMLQYIVSFAKVIFSENTQNPQALGIAVQAVQNQ